MSPGALQELLPQSGTTCLHLLRAWACGENYHEVCPHFGLVCSKEVLFTLQACSEYVSAVGFNISVLRISLYSSLQIICYIIKCLHVQRALFKS